MDTFKLTTPVAFIIFNRPDTTRIVFEEIKKAKPEKLLIIADGPRNNKPGEKERCAETRAIVENIDWECEVLRNYSDKNMGCKNRVASGLNWVFENVEEAIILEDDCLPDPSFFRYCQELLEKYRDDKRIMLISGDNMLFENNIQKYSYYFSNYPSIWGWATWRRAWQLYDINMTVWPEVKKEKLLKNILTSSYNMYLWENSFESVYSYGLDTWDYQWVFSIWMQSGLTIVPCKNLISNIGFGEAATHTHGNSIYSKMKIEAIEFPMTHPPYIIRDLYKDILKDKGEFKNSRFKWMGELLPILKVINYKIRKIIRR